MKYYISIHDVAPNNIEKIECIINLLQNQYGINKLCLLVIPGLKWEKKQVKQLVSWQDSGLEIAAHGWNHRAKGGKSLYHMIHGFFISGNCAEHLSKNRETIMDLIKKSYNWFVDNHFSPPTLYVPPAWALGNINTEDLPGLPFRNFECTTGIYFKEKYQFIPLVGFEATTYYRAFFLRFFNFLNYLLAKFIGVLRITIHPTDFQLYLANDINNYLSEIGNTILLHELS